MDSFYELKKELFTELVKKYIKEISKTLESNGISITKVIDDTVYDSDNISVKFKVKYRGEDFTIGTNKDGKNLYVYDWENLYKSRGLDLTEALEKGSTSFSSLKNNIDKFIDRNLGELNKSNKFTLSHRKIAERIVLGDEILKNPKSKPQKIFKKIVEEFIEKQNEIGRRIEVGYPEDVSPNYPYAFHDPKSVAVDADLYDILTNGEADFGIGRKMYEKLNDELDKAGYYLEGQGQGVFNFAQ